MIATWPNVVLTSPPPPSPQAAVRLGRGRQVQERDRVGIVEDFCGYRAHVGGCHMAQRSSEPPIRPALPPPPASGTPWESQAKGQGRDRVVIVETSCGHRASGVNIRENFVISRKLGYKTRGGGSRHVAKCSCDPILETVCHGRAKQSYCRSVLWVSIRGKFAI